MKNFPPRDSTPKQDANLDPAEAADFLVVISRRTLDNWRSQGRGPRYVRVGRRIVYRLSDLREWMAERTVETDNR